MFGTHHASIADMRIAIGSILLSLVLMGCGATVRSAADEVPRIAVPVTIDATLKALEDEQTRERVARVMATPEMQRAVQDFGVAVLRGAVEGGSDPEASERLRRLAARLADDFTRTLSEQLTREVIPAVRASLAQPLSADEEARFQALTGGLSDQFAHALGLELTREVIPAARASLLRPLSPEQEKALSDALSEVAGDATRKSLQVAAEEVPLSIGPAMRRSLVTELRSPELREAIAQTMADVTRETLIRSRAVIREMQAEPGAPGLLPRLDRLVNLAWAIAVGVAVGLSVLFVRALTAYRRDDAARRNAAAELASRAMDAARGKPWAAELGDLLKEQLRATESVAGPRRGFGRRARWPRRRRPAREA